MPNSVLQNLSQFDIVIMHRERLPSALMRHKILQGRKTRMRHRRCHAAQKFGKFIRTEVSNGEMIPTKLQEAADNLGVLMAAETLPEGITGILLSRPGGYVSVVSSALDAKARLAAHAVNIGRCAARLSGVCAREWTHSLLCACGLTASFQVADVSQR